LSCCLNFILFYKNNKIKLRELKGKKELVENLDMEAMVVVVVVVVVVVEEVVEVQQDTKLMSLG
jgi:hypothetical protein